LRQLRRGDDTLKLKWVEKRVWRERLEEREESEEDLVRVITEYRVREARGVVVFKTNLSTGITEVRIERFKSGDRENSYDTKMEFYKAELGRFLDFSQFDPIPLVAAVDALNDLEQSGFRRRDLQIKTEQRMVLGAKSPRGRDVAEEHRWVAAMREGEGEYYGNMAYVEWMSGEGPLSKDIGVKIYRGRNEVLIYPKCSEAELQHVLSRVVDFN